MTDNNSDPCQSPGAPVPNDRQVKRAPPPKAKENPWDHEPAWPGGESDDDGVVADGMCDDDDGPPSLRLPAPLGFQQSSLWNEALARIRAARFSSESSCPHALPRLVGAMCKDDRT